jgi:hypothetical protein
MRKLKISKIWIPAFLLALAMAACSDPDKNGGAGAGNPGAPLTPPTVTSVTPPNGFTLVCPNVPVITATFSKAMNPATIDSPATTFTLTSSGGSVSGTVTYVVATNIATFTPSNPPNPPLQASTTYTATITTGVTDTFGNMLAANFVWMFTTSATCPLPAAPVPLLTAGNFKILAGSTVTNTGPTTITGGDLGLSPGTAVTGFPPGTLNAPAVMHVTDPAAAQAQLDLTAAYNSAAGLASNAVLPGDLSGLTLTPGVYTNSSTVMISAGNFTLNAGGNPNAIFVFQVGSALTTLGSTQVVLAGGAQAKNVFWQVGSSATLGTSSIFKGTILALTSITLDNGASLQGRALARNGAVTMDSNTITDP